MTRFALPCSRPFRLLTALGALSVFATGQDVFIPDTFEVDDHPVMKAQSLRSADLDGDGQRDVIAGVNGGGVRVFAGQGDLTFDAPLEAGGGANRGIELADFDADGFLDVVSGNGQSAVSVLLGNGDLTFGAPVSWPTAPGASQPSVGDIDGDGTVDIAVPAQETIRVSLLAGVGDGTFVSLPDVGPIGDGGFTCALGDTDGDADLDLVVGNTYGSSVTYLQGDGAGGFTFVADEPVPISPDSVQLVDMDHDTVLDLLYLGGPGVHVRGGNGDGTFGPQVQLDTGFAGDELVVADMDEDGNPDVVAAGASSAVYVFLGGGDLTFDAAGRWGADLSPRPLTVGDFDGDGDLDVVTAAFSVPTLSVLGGFGDGTLGGSHVTGTRPLDLATADFDGDGRPDLVTVNETDETVSVLLNRGLGRFEQQAVSAAPFDASHVATADMDVDGNADIVVANTGNFGGRVWVLLGAGDGTFAPALEHVAANALDGLAVGELDGNPGPDVAVVSNGLNQVFVLFNEGDGSLAAPVGIPAGLASTGVTIGDWDLDGDGDLAIASWSSLNNVQLLFNDGAGGFGPLVGVPSQGSETWLTSADVTGDGVVDLLTTGVWNGAVTVIPGNGDGTFGAPQSMSPIGNPAQVATGDFDADGDVDLAVTAEDVLGDTGSVVLFENDGLGGFGNRQDLRTAANARGLVAADLDGDGVSDLAVACTTANHVSTLLSSAGPWADLGAPLAGAAGLPKQTGEGTLQAGDTFRFTLTDAPPLTTAFHVVGLGVLDAPFKGGTMVPTIDLVNDLPFTDAEGTAVLAGPWIGAPSGLTLVFQFWMVDAAGAKGFSASNAVSATMP